MDQYSGKLVLSKTNIKIEKWHLTCPLCKNLFRDATTLNVCIDTFSGILDVGCSQKVNIASKEACNDCINNKLGEDSSNCCADCKDNLGSSPIETLGPDVQKSTLISKTILKDKSARREDISITSQLSRKNCKVTKINAPGTKSAPQSPATSQENTGKSHDDNAVGENNYDVDQSPSPQSSKSITFKMQVTNKTQNQKRQAHHNEAAFDSTNKDEVLTKKKRNTRRRPRHHWKCDESSNVMAELSKPGPDGIERPIDAGEHIYKEELSEEFSNPLWFCLLSCTQETGNELPQIPKQYIKINNGNMPVSYINKYLVQKLNLQDESEVDVMCCGEPLKPSLALNELINIWTQAKFGRGEINLNLDEGFPDGEDFVMQLTYRRSNS